MKRIGFATLTAVLMAATISACGGDPTTDQSGPVSDDGSGGEVIDPVPEDNTPAEPPNDQVENLEDTAANQPPQDDQDDEPPTPDIPDELDPPPDEIPDDVQELNPCNDFPISPEFDGKQFMCGRQICWLKIETARDGDGSWCEATCYPAFSQLYAEELTALEPGKFQEIDGTTCVLYE